VPLRQMWFELGRAAARCIAYSMLQELKSDQRARWRVHTVCTDVKPALPEISTVLVFNDSLTIRIHHFQ